MRRSRPFGVAVACTVMALLVGLAFRTQTPNPEARLPARYRLADLIQRQQSETAALRTQVASLRKEVGGQRAAASARSAAVGIRTIRLDQLSESVGLRAMHGPGVKVTLADSDLREAPEGGNVNDLVIHSQDVQAVVNALWRAGAEAVSINGQRLVGTSAVLCVGNTLLLNGTVHSPPYVVSAVGASKDRFDTDRLVRRLKSAAQAFGLRLDVARASDLEVPAYRGATTLTYARPVASPAR